MLKAGWACTLLSLRSHPRPCACTRVHASTSKGGVLFIGLLNGTGDTGNDMLCAWSDYVWGETACSG